MTSLFQRCMAWLAFVAPVALLCGPCRALAGTIYLGPTAQSFAVLGAAAVTNTGSTVISGNLGVWPGGAVNGFLPGIVTLPATIHANDAVAMQAQNDVTSAYAFLAGKAFTSNLTGQNLGGLMLAPGVFRYNSSAQLTGTLILDFASTNDAIFIFQIGSTLTTASASAVQVMNLGLNDAVFWLIGSSATLGAGSAFNGNILATASVTLTTGANIGCGRALAENGAVTLDTNNVTSTCGSNGLSGSSAQSNSAPEPGTVTLFGIGLTGFAAAFIWRGRKKARVEAIHA